MSRIINSYSEFVVCEIINSESVFGNILYDKAIKYINVKRITIYKILERLREKGAIEITESFSKRKYYSITKEGKDALIQSRHIFPKINLNDYVEIGNNVIKLDTIDSTNAFLRMNNNSLNDGDVIVAKRQLSAAFKNGDSWESSIDSLEFSFLAKTHYEIENTIYLPQIVLSSIVKVLLENGIDAKITWPDRIIYNDKVIAGIRVEASFENGHTNNVIAGVFINLNNLSFEEDKYVSMKQISGNEFRDDSILKDFFRFFNKFHQDLIVSQFESFASVYIKSSDVIGKTFAKHGLEFVVVNITERGNLIVAFDNKLDLITSGEIEIFEQN